MISHFQNPPQKYRPLQFLLGYEEWFGEDEETIRRNLLRVKELGIGGLVVSVNQKQYLRSEKAWEVLRTGVRVSKELGLRLWIYDEEGYPSGAAGGLVLEKNPALEAMGLIQKFDDAGEPDYEVVPLYEGTHATENFYQKRRYINILDRRATSTFIEVTHDQYARHLGDLSQWFEAVFTDEPSLINAYVPKGRTYPLTLPWLRSIPEIFLGRKGYDLIPYIKSLYQDQGKDDRKVRCDFYELISELCAENYFGQIQKWCQEYGVASSGHLLGEETLVWQTYFEGDPFACYRKMDIPGIDMILSDPERIMHENYFLVPKLASSAARLMGKRGVMCEISDFIESMDKHPANFEQMIGTANILFALGVTELVSMYASAVFEALGRKDPNASQSPVVGVEEYIKYTAFTARLKTIFSEGRIETRVAVLYPIVSVWANFTPSNRSMYEPHPNERVRFIDTTFTNLCRDLIQHQIDFDILDDKAVADAEIIDDELVISGNRYSCIVLPPMDTARLRTVEKIAQYADQCGLVVAYALLPEYAAEGSEYDAEVKKVVKKIFANSRTKFVEEDNQSFAEVVKSRVKPNCELSPQSPDILCTRLTTKQEEIFFLANTSSQAWKGLCRFEASGNITLLYPESGEAIAADAVHTENSTTMLDVTLDPYRSVFVVFLNPKV